MKCQSCGQETKTGNFCENCGAKQEIAATSEAISTSNNSQVSVNLPQIKIGQISKKTKVILASVVVLLIIVFAGYKFGMSISSPQYVTEKYYNALKNKDYAAAYSYVDENSSKSLDKDAFITWQKNEESEKGAVTFFSVASETANEKSSNNNKLDSLNSNVIAKIQRSKDTDKRDDFNKLIKVKEVLGLFPVWKIDLPKENKSFNISFDGAKLFVDGRDSGFETSRKNGLEVKVYQGNHKYELKANNIKPIVIEQNGYISGYVVPNDNVQKDIEKSMGTLGDKFIEAYNSKNSNALNGLASEKGIKLIMKDVEDSATYIPSLTKQAQKPMISELYMVSPTEATLYLTFYFECKKKGYFGDELTDSSTYFYYDNVSVKQKDGKWLLDTANQGGY